jgi:hypothetical protein
MTPSLCDTFNVLLPCEISALKCSMNSSLGPLNREVRAILKSLQCYEKNLETLFGNPVAAVALFRVGTLHVHATVICVK